MYWKRAFATGAAAAGATVSYLHYSGLHAFSAAADQPHSVTKPKEAAPRLKLVQVVFRHGARTPLTHYTNELAPDTKWDVCGEAYKAVQVELRRRNGDLAAENPHDLKQVQHILPGGCSRGELTMIGQVQALQLGHWLRDRYILDLGFLPYRYEEGIVQSRTTNYSRTVATLRGVLTGIYPDAQQPVKVTTSGDLDEILFADSKTCPHLKVLFKQAAQRAIDIRSQPEYIELVNTLKTAFPHTSDKFWQGRGPMVDVHDILTSLKFHGKLHPEQVTSEVYKKVEEMATKLFRSWSAPVVSDSLSGPIIQLSMGRLLAMLLTNMEGAASASSTSVASTSSTASSQSANAPGTSKLYLYSGHDSTIFPLLVALGLDVSHWPPYASNVVFELWETAAPDGSTSHEVRVLYNRQEVQLPGCVPGAALELSVFKERVVGPFLLSDQAHDEACSVTLEHSTSMPQASSKL